MPGRSNRSDRTGWIKPLAAALGGIAAVGGGAILATAAYLVKRTTQTRRGRRPVHFTFTPWEFQIPYETVRIPVDGEMIDCWLMKQPDESSPVILALPGFGSTKAELLGISSALYRQGYSCFLIDYRGAGRSEGDMLTLGHTELADAQAALDWTAHHLPNAPIGVLGFSLGGSIALQLTSLDSRIQAVVADSPFASQRGVLAYHVRRSTRLPAGLILDAASPLFRVKHGYRYDQFAPVDVIHRITPRPFLLIHGTEDRMVPVDDAYELWRHAGEPKERWILDGLGHCGAYFEFRESYTQRVGTFFGNALLRHESSGTGMP